MHHKAPRSCSTTCIAKHFRSRGSSSTWLPRGGGGGGQGESVRKGQRVRRVRWPLIDSSPRVSCPSSATCSIYQHEFTYIFERTLLSALLSGTILNFVPCSPFVFVRRSTQSHERRKSGISRSIFLSSANHASGFLFTFRRSLCA